MAVMIHFILSSFLVAIAQVVLIQAELTFNITTIHQCEPFTITFMGMPSSKILQTTASLSLIPLESAPLVIPMTRVAVNTASIYLTSIPLPAGTWFVASLEDGLGRSIARVSDLINILPSDQTGHDFCLPQAAVNPRRFTLADDPSQCQEFTIQYNTTNVTKAPTVTAYNPKGISLVLNNTFDDPSMGVARYLMGLSAEKEVTLLMDGNNFRETTSLITVSGNSSSSSECLSNEKEAEALLSTTGKIPSKAIIIGASSGGAAVILIGLAMAIFIIRDRRKRRTRRLQAASFDGSRMFNSPIEKAPFSRLTMPETPRIQTGSVVDPTYATLEYPQDERTTPWGMNNQRQQQQQWAARPGHISGQSIARSETRNVVPYPNYDGDRLSLNSLDIEGMLNMATMQSESPNRKSSIPMVFGQDGKPSFSNTRSPEPVNQSLPELIIPPPRRVLKVNSDIPAGALSATPSLFSFRTSNANPFVPDEEIISRASRRYQPPLSVLRTPGGSFGLPTSPRSVMLSPGRASIAGTNRSSSDWYGVGIAR